MGIDIYPAVLQKARKEAEIELQAFPDDMDEAAFVRLVNIYLEKSAGLSDAEAVLRAWMLSVKDVFKTRHAKLIGLDSWKACVLRCGRYIVVEGGVLDAVRNAAGYVHAEKKDLPELRWYKLSKEDQETVAKDILDVYGNTCVVEKNFGTGDGLRIIFENDLAWDEAAKKYPMATLIFPSSGYAWELA